jgi:Family of unknown function (DUF5681)
MKDEDSVGYKRPPKSGRFKSGQSGNPKGRKKHVANFKTDLTAELRELIVVRENGRERRITKQQAFIKTLMALAIKGDIRAINAIVACTRNFGTGADPTHDEGIDQDDLNILQDYIDRQNKTQTHSSAAKSKKDT